MEILNAADAYVIDVTEADFQYDRLLNHIIPISHVIIKKANAFRLANKTKKFSYIDCVGFMMAKALSIPFLTGDRSFEGMEGVEYVK